MSYINLLSGQKVDASLTDIKECKECGTRIRPAWLASGKKIWISLIANGFIDHKENCWGQKK